MTIKCGMELAKYIHGFQSNSKATLKDQEGRRVEQLLNCSFLKSTQFRKKNEYNCDATAADDDDDVDDDDDIMIMMMM